MKNNKIKNTQGKLKAIFHWFFMIFSSLFAFTFLVSGSSNRTNAYIMSQMENSTITNTASFSKTLYSQKYDQNFTLDDSYARNDQVPKLVINYLNNPEVIQKSRIAFSYQHDRWGSRYPFLRPSGIWITKNSFVENKFTGGWRSNNFEEKVETKTEYVNNGYTTIAVANHKQIPAAQKWLFYENLQNYELNHSWIENGNSFPLELRLNTTSLNKNLLDWTSMNQRIYEFWNENIKPVQHNQNFKAKIANLQIDVRLHLAGEKYKSVKLKQVELKLNFKIYYEYTNPKKTELDNFLKEKSSKFNQERPTILFSPTDSTSAEGLKTKPAANEKSNEDLLNNEMTIWTNWLKLDKYHSFFDYEVIEDNPNSTRINIFIHFLDPITKTKKKYFVGEKKLQFVLSEKAKKKTLNQRLIFIPSKVVKKQNNKYVTVDDEPEILIAPQAEKRENNVVIEDGGTVVYHAPVLVSFTTFKELENEILFINGQKIDVLDQKFSIKLNDKKTKQFIVEVFQYSKNNNQNSNQNIVRKYKKIITIKSKVKKFNIKYFAWNPSNNIDQLIKISPFLKNWITGEEILNEKGDSERPTTWL